MFICEHRLIQSPAPLFEFDRPPDATGQYFEGTATNLEAILALIAERRQRQLRTEIGYVGGARKLRETTIDSLASRKWKWCDPNLNLGKRSAANWIDDQKFEQIIEELYRSAVADE